MHSRKKVIRIAVKAVTRLWRTRAWCWSCCFIIYQYCSLGLLVVIVACLFYEHVFIDAMTCLRSGRMQEEVAIGMKFKMMRSQSEFCRLCAIWL